MGNSIAALVSEGMAAGGAVVPERFWRFVAGDATPVFQQAACRLAQRLNVAVSWTPGTHTPYLDHPVELVRAIRLLLRQMSCPEHDKIDVERP